MHLLVTKSEYKGKISRHAKIVESYRFKNSVRKKVILSLGPVRSEADMKKYKDILYSMNEGREFFPSDELIAKTTREFGVTYTVSKLLEKHDLDIVLKKELYDNNLTFDAFELLRALIVNRLIEPSSDYKSCEWINTYYPKRLDVKPQWIYRFLDKLEERKEDLEKGIFSSLKKNLGLDTKRVHYDLTSSYVEGKCCTIALFGHTRDNRKDRAQVVIGLAMCDGVPIMHEVHKGNTVDKATLKGLQKNLKERLGIKRSTIVSDAGLMTNTNLEHLEDEGYSYLIGMYRRNNNKSKELLKTSISSKKNQFAKEVHKETIEREGKTFVRRYILCIDNSTRKERLNTLERVKKKRLNGLKELKTRYEASQKSKGRKISKGSCLKQAQKIVGAKNRFIDIKFENTLEYSLNTEKYDYEKKIAGKFLLVTNAEMNAFEAMKTYKGLQRVENAFDEIKNFLDVRPLHHQKPRRVKAHVFVCVLAFLIESLIERKCKASARKVVWNLKTIGCVELGTKEYEKTLVTSLSSDSEEIFKELKIAKPLVVAQLP